MTDERRPMLVNDIETLTRRIAEMKRAVRLLEADLMGLQRQLDTLNQYPLEF